MPTVLVRPDAVCQRFGFRRSQLYAMISRGEFPRPINISARATAFVETELEDWATARIAASRRDSETLTN